jgi:hypothetical protein
MVNGFIFQLHAFQTLEEKDESGLVPGLTWCRRWKWHTRYFYRVFHLIADSQYLYNIGSRLKMLKSSF